MKNNEKCVPIFLEVCCKNTMSVIIYQQALNVVIRILFSAFLDVELWKLAIEKMI